MNYIHDTLRVDQELGVRKAKSLGPCGAHGVRRACMGRLRVWDHVEPMVSGVHVWEG